ncbi:MAG TPA: glutamate synthase large subunit [Vicinamibacterales bacterium]|nr:glutamate synthase large subunit [Vicinamibacterales bacterium]
MSHLTGYPLYRPELEHDACGVGFLADVAGRPRRDVVLRGLTALERLAHRGASPALATIDGCGVMTAIPWTLLARELAARDIDGYASRALGMFFSPPGASRQMRSLVERALRRQGAAAVVWRDVPVEPGALAPSVRATAPEIHQAVIGFTAPAAGVEGALFRARLDMEHLAASADDALPGFAVVSLSTRTVVYKGLLEPSTLAPFYGDLRDPAFESSYIVFHQRFSTNTAADWSMAQPFRVLAHNGEINTIAGNRLWMRARAAAELSARLGGLQPVGASGSDSHTLDETVDLLRAHGFSAPHAIARLLPPEWERDRDLPDEVRAFHEYQALVSEPWEGPAALVFCDGRYLGASLDRNGFRPLRVAAAADNLIAVASEAGVLNLPDEAILDRGRLGPGEILLVDLARHVVMAPAAVRRLLARQQPYRRLVDSAMIPSRTPLLAPPRQIYQGDDLLRRQALFLYSHEEIDLILRPMAATGAEPSGSMGDDTPPAALSARDRLLSDFFRQRFAQVTNPPIDPHREASVMSLRTLIGAQGPYLDESRLQPRRLALTSPIVSSAQLHALSCTSELHAAMLMMRFDAALGVSGFATALEALVDDAIRAVQSGASLLILSDRAVDAAWAPLPALLVTAAIHHRLIDAGLRLRVSLMVDTAAARDAHQVAALCAYGASAVCPYLAYDTVASLALADATGRVGGTAGYRLALERGLLKVASKMGVCTMSAYCGAQLFEILGLDRALAQQYFPGTPSPLGGLTLDDLAERIVARHARIYGAPAQPLEHPGQHGYRRNGEYHAVNPLVVKKLHHARAAAPADRQAAYDEFAALVHSRPPTALRDLLAFVPQTPIPLSEVEPADAICRRFFASAMSVGALSPEAHRVVAVAMNRLGARSNSGEGGEEPGRFVQPRRGDWSGSRTKQVASARFGVTPAYLRSADELQIKIAQGSKPGEGGQLPGEKVVPHIAALRCAQPGTALISPPVHHDIYSIEDLAQLVFDLRAVNPSARINVKLVATTGVGIIAAGVAKAGADAIQISGHDGGTGASPRGSIKHAGMPWELGLAEAHQVLTRQGLRHRVTLQTDGGFKTGRDVAVAAALGAEEYGFGTAALVAIGCVMARQCHLNTCPAGIASQRVDLRARFAGTPEMLIGYLRLVAEDVRAILASLGLSQLDELVGRADLLAPHNRAGVNAARLDLSPLLVRVPRRTRRGPAPAARPPVSHKADDDRIANTDRAYGASIAGAIAARHGDAGLPANALRRVLTGSGGQSFGAFTLPGMHLTIIGDANDYVAKGMHGGELIVRPRARERGRQAQVLVGNTALYGATGGRLFIAGRAGERFAVRNSGATAVVEGVGDHGCEYMTGGVVLILGPTGKNFAAGMSGGTAYVFDPGARLGLRCNLDLASIGPLDLSDQARVRALLDAHRLATGSRKARALLQRFDQAIPCFRRVAARPLAEAVTAAEETAVELAAIV